VAGSAYAALRPHAEAFDRVVLIGPAHRVYVRGLAAPSVSFFRTPLGDVPLDRHAIDLLVAEGLAHVDDGPHAPEHGIEVHLPFLQRILGAFLLVPLVVGEASAAQVAAALAPLWRTPRTLLVVSTDLSHFLDYGAATARDARTALAIEEMVPAQIQVADACGWLPLRGALVLALRDGLTVSRLDLRNSGDTQGDKDRVVGYGAWVIS
jgi:AmmeMemoRadiSam system protein B